MFSLFSRITATLDLLIPTIYQILESFVGVVLVLKWIIEWKIVKENGSPDYDSDFTM